MNDDTRLDDGLARLTDALMEGREVDASTERPDLENVVRQLHRTLTHGESADPAYRAHLERRLLQEFDRVHRRQPQRLSRRQLTYVLAAAAGLALVLVAVLLAGPSVGGGALQGAATGEAAAVGVAVIALVLLVAVVIVWRRR